MNDQTIQLMYDASKHKHKPKQTARSRYKEILSIEDGGLSYWSNKTHRWIQGRFDKKKKNIFYSSQTKFIKDYFHYFYVFV